MFLPSGRPQVQMLAPLQSQPLQALLPQTERPQSGGCQGFLFGFRKWLPPPIPWSPSPIPPLSVVSSVCPSPALHLHPPVHRPCVSKCLGPIMDREASMMPRFTPSTFQVWPGTWDQLGVIYPLHLDKGLEIVMTLRAWDSALPWKHHPFLLCPVHGNKWHLSPEGRPQTAQSPLSAHRAPPSCLRKLVWQRGRSVTKAPSSHLWQPGG